MLQARELTKRYGGLLALDRVSFELRPGEIVGYLGPNGSGKSTTVNLVVGLLEPSAGDISLGGIRASEDPIAYKRRIGYIPEEPSLYAHLTASAYLAFTFGTTLILRASLALPGVALVVALMAGAAAGALSLHRTRQAPHTPLLFEDELPIDVNPLRLNPD